MAAPKGNTNTRTHGATSLLDSGPSKLIDPAEVSRMAELRQLVKSEPGRQEIREELTARMALICDLGFSHLAREQRAGKDIWAGGIIRRLGSYTAETRRLLDSFSELPAGFDAEHERIKKVLEHDEIKDRLDTKNGDRAKEGGSPDS